MKTYCITAATVAFALTTVAAEAQHEGHSMGAQQAPTEGPSPELVTACIEAQRQVSVLADQANAGIEMARQTNSLRDMRAAVADLQAALVEIRTRASQCAPLEEAAPPADPHAGHTMSTSETTTPEAADPHAGHVMPGALQTPAPARATPQAPAAPQAAPGRPAASTPAAPDPHAGHVMPGAPQTATPTRATPPRTPQPQAAAPPQATTRAGAKPPAAAAGQDMANTPRHNMANMSTGASSPETTLDLPTRPQDLACATKVDPRTAPRAAYAGKTYYFCSAVERDRFVKAPAAYRPKR